MGCLFSSDIVTRIQYKIDNVALLHFQLIQRKKRINSELMMDEEISKSTKIYLLRCTIPVLKSVNKRISN